MNEELVKNLIAAFNNVSEVAKNDKSLQSIAKDVDFRPYYEAVIKSSERSRSTIYLIFIVSIAVFITARNHVMPAWLYSRLSYLQTAQSCMYSNDYESIPCKQSIQTAIRHIYSQDQISPSVKMPSPEQNNNNINTNKFTHRLNSIKFQDQVKTQIENLLKRKTESLSVQMPIIGLQIDINDTGLISGGIFLLLFFILNTNLSREILNLREANNIAPDYRSRKLLLMAQVLSGTRGSKIAPPKLSSYLLIITPFISLGYLVLWDLRTIEIADILAGAHGISVVIMETLFLITLIPMMTICFYKWNDINKELNKIQEIITKEEKSFKLKEKTIQ